MFILHCFFGFLICEQPAYGQIAVYIFKQAAIAKKYVYFRQVLKYTVYVRNDLIGQCWFPICKVFLFGIISSCSYGNFMIF